MRADVYCDCGKADKVGQVSKPDFLQCMCGENTPYYVSNSTKRKASGCAYPEERHFADEKKTKEYKIRSKSILRLSPPPDISRPA
jgi:hypothetical protein